MKTIEIKKVLQSFFEGKTTIKEERELETYFQSDEVAEELKGYRDLFTGICELAESVSKSTIEDDIMVYIHEKGGVQKSKRRWMWHTLTGIAASVILAVGGYLVFQQQEQQLNDTFDNPEIAYAYAEQTLTYVSEKYNEGLAALSNFGKLETAALPMQKGVKPVNEYMEMVKKLNTAEYSN